MFVMQLNFKRQAGATLIEIIMVVALMAIITIGALTYYNSASQSSKVQETVTTLTALTSMIRNQFSAQGNYTGLDEVVVAAFGNVPKTMRVDDTTDLKHPWSSAANAVKIGPMNGAGTASEFYVQLADLPTRACTDIVTKTFKSFGVLKGTAGTAPASSAGAYATIAAAVAGCGGNVAGADSTIVTMNFYTK
jgi:type II secretory pathway pseudopilin PulG